MTKLKECKICNKAPCKIFMGNSVQFKCRCEMPLIMYFIEATISEQTIINYEKCMADMIYQWNKTQDEDYDRT